MPRATGICESFHIRAQPGAVKRALSERVARERDGAWSLSYLPAS